MQEMIHVTCFSYLRMRCWSFAVCVLPLWGMTEQSLAFFEKLLLCVHPNEMELRGMEGNMNPFYQPFLLQGDLQRTNIQLDFGDGIAVSYANFSPVEDGVRHVYKSAGIFQVTAYAENSLGSDTAVLFLHVVCEYFHLPDSLGENLTESSCSFSVVPVASKRKCKPTYTCSSCSWASRHSSIVK